MASNVRHGLYELT